MVEFTGTTVCFLQKEQLPISVLTFQWNAKPEITARMAYVSSDVTSVHPQVHIPGPLLVLDSAERSYDKVDEPEVLWPTPSSSVHHAFPQHKRPFRQRLAFAPKEHILFTPKVEEGLEPTRSHSPMIRMHSQRRWKRPTALGEIRDSPSEVSLYIGRPADISPSVSPSKVPDRVSPELPVMDYYKRLNTRPDRGFRTPNTHQRRAASKGGYRTKLQKDPVISRSALGLYVYVDCYDKDEGFLKKMQSAVRVRRKNRTKS